MASLAKWEKTTEKIDRYYGHPNLKDERPRGQPIRSSHAQSSMLMARKGHSGLKAKSSQGCQKAASHLPHAEMRERALPLTGAPQGAAASRSHDAS